MKTKTKRFAAMSLALALAVSAAGCQSKEPEATTPEAGIYTPGTYKAEAQGFGGAVTVEMTFDAEKITEVKIVGDGETEGIGSNAVAEIGRASCRERV